MRRMLPLLFVTACAVGAPPGFSDGDLWTFPLVAPLEDDLVLVPVYVGARKQPVLFMIDPDSRTSSIDAITAPPRLAAPRRHTVHRDRARAASGNCRFQRRGRRSTAG